MTLLICILLSVLGFVLVRIRKAKKVTSKTNRNVSDDTEKLPDLSEYNWQYSGFMVEEDITFVHTNKNTG